MAGRIKHNTYIAKPRDIFAREKLRARSPSAADTADTLQPSEIIKRVPTSVWDLGGKK